MADDLSWDDDEYEVPSVVKDVPVSKLDEEEEEEEEVKVAKPAAKKAAAKAGAKPAAGGASLKDEVLADPVAEKLRQQRLQESADLEHARAAFGDASKNLDELLPRTEADFSEYGELIYHKYFRANERNSSFKAGIKAIVRAAAASLSVHELKDLESSVIAVRNQKLKEEKEAATKGKKVAAGKAKPSLKAGFLEGDLDEARYATTALDDDYDFM